MTLLYSFHLILVTWPLRVLSSAQEITDRGDHRQGVVQHTLIFNQRRANRLGLISVQKGLKGSVSN